jgi:regulator of protease activity HflC (stomatin/prohibitin superfamily)
VVDARNRRLTGSMARARGHEPLRPVKRPLPRSPRRRARATGLGSAYEPLAEPKRRGDPPLWALRLMRKRGSRRLGTLIAALIGVALIVAVSGVRFERQQVGYVGVVRNGGPLDDRTIRQVLLPGQRLTWTGFFSESPHQYPASNVSRTYTVTSDPRRGSRPGVDVVTVPTKDGVQVGVEATVFMRFVGERDLDVLTRFDISFGTRRFPTASGKRRLYPWDGDDGFYTWLDNFFRPVLEYNLRREIGRFDCAELVASCSLVRSGKIASGAPLRTVPTADAGVIANRISSSLERDLTRTLGQPYFWDLRMRIARVSLPKDVQAAVDEAQANYVEVNTSKAQLRQAQYEARQKRLLGSAYNASPGLANIEALKALPKQATVILSTNGQTPNILAAPQGGLSTGSVTGSSTGSEAGK